MSAELYHEIERLEETRRHSESNDWESDMAKNFVFNQKIYDEAVNVYEEAAAPFATCRYLGTIGNEFIHPDIQSIVALHDKMTRALESEKLTLA